MRGGWLFGRLSVLGAGTQSALPGIYAWGVTVAPTMWAGDTSALAKAISIVALLALAAGVACEARWGARARAIAFWGFVVSSATVWALAPIGLGAIRLDTARGLAGTFGWSLYAFVSAAPALSVQSDPPALVDEVLLDPRKTLARGDTTYVIVGGMLAASLQAFGWTIANAERALLVRFTAIAAGLSLIGASTSLALVRHVPRATPSPARRLRRAMAALVTLGILTLAGVLFAVRG